MVKFQNGKIVTDLEAVEFFSLILKEWADYPPELVETIVGSIEDWELEDFWLRTDGYLIADNSHYKNDPDTVNLIKVGEGEWIVLDYTNEEMEEFVDSIQGNLDIS